MRVLVTNDDGIDAPGIAALASGLVVAGHEVTVVAPDGDASGCGTGTGPQRRDIVDRFAASACELGGARAFRLDALPALCVTAAHAGAFGPPPELVVSGVNAGRNVGRSVLHSGTVGAAVTAAQLGIPAIAASAQTRRGEPAEFAAAVWLTCRLLPVAAAAGPSVLNCNTPDRGLGELAGVRLAPLGDAELVRSARLVGGVLELRFLRRDDTGAADSDEALTDAGYATVTPLAGAFAGLRVVEQLASALLAIEGELAGR